MQTASRLYKIYSYVCDWNLAGPNKVIDVRQYGDAYECITGTIRENNWKSLVHLRYARLTAHAALLVHDRPH